MIYSNYKGKNIETYSTGGIIGSTLSGIGSGAGIGASFGPEGALIGAGVGLIGGLVEGLVKNSAEKKQEEERARNEYVTREQARALDDANRLNNYYTNGYDQETLYNKGGMIKKEHKGKFTRWAKEHHMTLAEATKKVLANRNKYSPSVIKMAIFARNFGGYNNGGEIPTINTKSNTHKIGDGIQVTGNTNKDKIKATVDGTPVKLDNKEIVVQYHGNPVVISDDLGEADKYRAELKAGGNPKRIADKYAIRAIMLEHNNNNHLADGGIPIGNDLYIDGTGKIHHKYEYVTLTNPEYYNSSNYIGDNTNIIPTTKNNTLTNNNLNTNYIPIATKTFANTVNNLNYPTVESLNIPTRNITGNINRIGSNDLKLTPFNFGDDNNGKNSSNSLNITGLAQGASALGSIISNISANSKLQHLNIPRPYLPQYVNRNINVDAPIFEHQIHSLNSAIGNLSDNVLNNTSNSNVALARLGSLTDKKISAENNIYSNQLADRNRIENENIAQQNRFNLINANLMNNYNNQQYQANIGKIQSDLALSGSTLATINGLVNNMKRDKYQNEYLQAIAKQVGFNPNGNFDINNLTSMQQAQLTKLLRQAGLTN